MNRKDTHEHSCCGKNALADKHDCCGESGNQQQGEAKPPEAAKYFCPMCPGVESDKPGDCSKRGMALERNPAWKQVARTIYTCPMHPEVEQDHPGECPKCGMALEAKTVTAEPEDDGEPRDTPRRRCHDPHAPIAVNPIPTIISPRLE